MNYLAHLVLAQPNRDSLTGNLMGDFLQGVDRTKLPTAINNGILNHFAVDKFTDTHPQVKELRSLFSMKYRRFAPIIIDISFDYLLSQNWDTLIDTPRLKFIHTAQDQLLANKDAMPQRMAKMVDTLIEYDIFNSYNTLAGLDNALNRTAARLRTFYGALEEVEPLLPQMQDVFIPFWGELTTHIEGRQGSTKTF